MGPGRRARGGTVLACAWPALLLATLCLLPYLNKAFLIDDPWFLAMARQILKSPLQPMNFDICWDLGFHCGKAYEMGPGNTLMGYALVPTILAGEKEWIAHATQLVFVWIGVLAMASLMLQMGWGRGYAATGALLLVAIPPLLPMAATAMPDVLAMTISLIGIERLAAWKSERKWHQGATAAMALGLAGMARVHLALLLPLVAFFLLDSLKARAILCQICQTPLLWAPVLIGSLILMGAILATRERGLVLTPPSEHFRGVSYIRTNLRSYLLYFCFPLPLAACWAVCRWTPFRIALTVLAATTVALVTCGGLKTILVLIGGYVLAGQLWDVWKRRDREGLFLGLWMLVPLPIVYYGHLPIKYLLPCVPAVIITCGRLTSAMSLRTARIAGIFVITLGLAYSLLILKADAEYANAAREALNALIKPHVLAGEKVWVPGHQSGYWYASVAGAEPVLPGIREPKQGELLVVGIREGNFIAPLERFPKRKLLQTITHTYRFGRTMFEGAGFYYNPLGDWLWTPGNGEGDRYELWRIE